jgi:hypothetical protein
MDEQTRAHGGLPHDQRHRSETEERASSQQCRCGKPRSPGQGDGPLERDERSDEAEHEQRCVQLGESVGESGQGKADENEAGVEAE